MTAVTAAAEVIRDKAAGEFVCDFVSRLPTTPMVTSSSKGKSFPFT